MGRAIEEAQKSLASVLVKVHIWESIATVQLNERQIKVLNLLADDVQGKLTLSKWAKLTKRSRETAVRDIVYLMEHGILVRNPGGGHSTGYAIEGTNQQNT